MSGPDLDQVIEMYHRAAGEFVKGNPGPYKELFSQHEDVTLANPFGPVKRGWKQVSIIMEQAAAQYRDGQVISFENVAKVVTPELAFIVEVERFKARLGKKQDISPIALRTTSIFRLEDGTWKIVHRHADPITAPQPWESIIQG